MSEEAVMRLQQAMKNEPQKTMVLAVSSGKGGVGKTNIAANLAVCLSASGKKVVLVDADWGLANLDVVMGINSRYNIRHVIESQKSIDSIVQEAPGGVEVVCGVSGLEDLANLDHFQRQRLLNELESFSENSDVMIIDTAAGISKSVISFCLAADHTLLVTTPEPTAMTDVYATIKALFLNKYQGRMSLVVNMADSLVEGRGIYRQIAEVAERFLNVEVHYGAVLLKDERVGKAVRQREPVVLAYPGSAITSSIVAMAARLGKGSAAKPISEGFFRKVVNWFI